MSYIVLHNTPAKHLEGGLDISGLAGFLGKTDPDSILKYHRARHHPSLLAILELVFESFEMKKMEPSMNDRDRNVYKYFKFCGAFLPPPLLCIPQN